ncbi:MAG: GGDEF domain-containing protein, partial [Faecousia sp.]
MFALYAAISLIAFFTLVITMVDAATNQLVSRRTKYRTVGTCLLIAAAALGEFLGVMLDGGAPSAIWPHRIAKAVELSLAPAIGVAVAISYGNPWRPKLAISLVAVHGLFEWVGMFCGWVFLVDGQNLYHRQALFPLYVAAFVLSVIYGFAGVIRNGKAFQIGIDSSLVFILLLLGAGIGVLFLSGVRIAYPCIALGNLLVYTRYYKVMLQVDAVTGLLNRRCYDVSITDLASRAVILFFDVDKFKQVNDTYGHSVGDLCLKNVARQLREVYGKHGLCYRTGGDEFCVILSQDIEQTEALNRQFREQIQALRHRDNRMPEVSLGFALYDAAVSRIQDVVEEADAML